MINNK